MKRVKRTYITKSGKKRTYTYEYDKKYSYKHKSKKGKVLVSASGKVNKKNVADLKAEIMAKDGDTATKKQLCNRLDAYVKQRSKHKEGRLTTNGFFAHEANDKAEQFAASLGYSISELAGMYNLDEADLRDPSSWKDDELVASGRIFKINHNYTGDVLEEII